MDESILEFVKSVEITSCRVTNTPHLVFLCGGATAPTPSSSVLSARDYFYRHIKLKAPDLAKRVRLAEEINDWFDGGTFEDLLDMEAYLADSSDLTILFVESPGSIAELGAFAASESLRGRTLAILNSSHPVDRTFIADGPVRRIKVHDSNLVRYYEWDSGNPANPSNIDLFEEMSKDIVEYVDKRARAASKEQVLDKDSHGHTMFLIADLIDVIGITTATEITDCLSLWNYSLAKKSLQKYLFLLKHLGLLRPKPYADQTYYMGAPPSALIRYDFLPGTKVRDRGRIKANIRAALSTSDKRRMKVYERDLAGARRTRRRRV